MVTNSTTRECRRGGADDEPRVGALRGQPRSVAMTQTAGSCNGALLSTWGSLLPRSR